jgi:thioredoxin reductase
LIHYQITPIIKENGKKIIVVGAGDVGFDYALNLSRHNQVTILNRSKQHKCIPTLKDRAQKAPSIEYHSGTSISEISKNSQGCLRIECINPEGKIIFDADYLVFAIGRDPNLGFLMENMQQKYSKLKENGQLFYLGDVVNLRYRQTSIAVGDGVRAAMDIFNKFRKAKA